MPYRIEFEVVSVASLSKVQQKINTWLTTKHLRKYNMRVLPDGNLLFEYCIYKEKPAT